VITMFNQILWSVELLMTKVEAGKVGK
jgi:hypothetical protein